MFSDTHFHFKMMTDERGINGVEVLSQMAKNNCFFGLDIGTGPSDLEERQLAVEKCIAGINDVNLADKARSFMYFSAGIWPGIESIKDRENQVKLLKDSIIKAQNETDQDTLHRKIIAIGEAGLDHHWNPSGADGRKEEDFDEQIYRGEKELFMMQLELSKEMNLPMIVHSRDAFSDTLDCIKNVGWNRGIIHCYSYGIEEARAFLDLGWYIAFGGGTTYTKKSKMEQMLELLKFVPKDRLLCETDAPYLAPVPHRGESNTPVLISHVYDFISNAREISVEELNETVDKNIKTLFAI